MTISQQRLDQLGCVLGLDCSRYQQNIYWNKAYAAGIKFAYVKITEGATGYEGTVLNLKARVQSAQANKVKVGYYHFARPGDVVSPENDAMAEIVNIQDHLNILPVANLPLVLDLEAYATSDIWTDKAEHMDRFINTFITNFPSIILYSNKSFLDINTALGYGTWPLFIAAYPNNPEVSLPAIPLEWSDWTMWQFTEKGTIDGYNGSIDLNVMKKDFFSQF